eukprot:1178395-Prorocentrum_minimum.AAC.10
MEQAGWQIDPATKMLTVSDSERPSSSMLGSADDLSAQRWSFPQSLPRARLPRSQGLTKGRNDYDERLDIRHYPTQMKTPTILCVSESFRCPFYEPAVIRDFVSNNIK